MKTQSINDLAGVLTIANSFPSHYIFRGQSNAEWGLVSSLERVLDSNWSSTTARTYEDYSLMMFQQKYHIYDHENSEPNSKLSWLAAMQHYGAPTRLIDFTESFYVALYFAIEGFTSKGTTDFSVYAIDYRRLREISIEILKCKSSRFTGDKRDIENDADAIFDEFIDPESYDVAWTTEPKQCNVRLDRQSGTFLLSGNREKRIQEILALPEYAEVDQRKITFNENLYGDVYAALKRANLNSKTLYGDLGGLAKSIAMELSVRSQIQ